MEIQLILDIGFITSWPCQIHLVILVAFLVDNSIYPDKYLIYEKTDLLIPFQFISFYFLLCLHGCSEGRYVYLAVYLR